MPRPTLLGFTAVRVGLSYEIADEKGYWYPADVKEIIEHDDGTSITSMSV